jgi:hypothetical protein
MSRALFFFDRNLTRNYLIGQPTCGSDHPTRQWGGEEVGIFFFAGSVSFHT